MEIRRAKLATCSTARGAVVVIDVLRSFTTAAYAFAAGAVDILPVDTPDEARTLRTHFPKALTIGAIGGGWPIPDFDFSNSPAQVANQNFRGRRLIQCTAAGVRGLVQCHQRADILMGASMVCARATAAFLLRHNPPVVTLVETGEWTDRDGDEDRACADYITALLEGRDPDPDPFIVRVRTSDFGRRFGNPAYPALDKADLDYASQADRFAFALQVERSDGMLVMTPTT